MGYFIKEIFYSLQGEGHQQGRAAVFCRFTGCNLWSGLEKHRHKARCDFCDTDFIGTDGVNGGFFEDAANLVEAIMTQWQNANSPPYVICTGGEPLLQLDAPLIDALHQAGCIVAVETNGTKAAPDGIDWLCVSPKGDSQLRLMQGDELKLVYPQTGIDPADFSHLDFDYFYLQPMALPDGSDTRQACLDYCLAHPQWRLSLQMHKILAIA